MTISARPRRDCTGEHMSAPGQSFMTVKACHTDSLRGQPITQLVSSPAPIPVRTEANSKTIALKTNGPANIFCAAYRSLSTMSGGRKFSSKNSKSLAVRGDSVIFSFLLVYVALQEEVKRQSGRRFPRQVRFSSICLLNCNFSLVPGGNLASGKENVFPQSSVPGGLNKVTVLVVETLIRFKYPRFDLEPDRDATSFLLTSI
eukprot:CAMPEP_0177614846 /NCGR_PEP_ID=MMETSP0419_2-20121207/23014_1 /TAXON_ID=582737 /ORGANISM="Tetraselmis sp., Strain GSL018" /LENGTH=201 /DNA_ID=CAMNT_0019112213 /DNA_START=117 /DNA_END=722 /DNA_ORIENTATION=+